MKIIRYFLEAFFLGIAFCIFKILPVVTASNFGGWLGRTIGPRLAASRKAFKNISASFPEKTTDECNALVIEMWDNLGRVMAEYPHLSKIVDTVEVTGKEYLETMPPSFVVIGGHVANWEVMPFFFNHLAKIPVTSIYRAPNNPYVAQMLERARDPGQSGLYTPKSTKGSRDLLKTMQHGGRTLILFDQKYNQGIVSNFFGRPAKTSPSFAQIARKYNCPVLPVWVERLNGPEFRIVIDKPIDVSELTDDQALEIAHSQLENHIRRNPAQWLWLHRRWIT